VDGANTTLLVGIDDNATPDIDNDASAAFTDNTFWEFKIDMSTVGDVGFYYRATLGGAWTQLLSGTTFPMAAAANLQPFFQMTKASDANTDSMTIDYVEVYWTRT
jgi:hypothetical protein